MMDSDASIEEKKKNYLFLLSCENIGLAKEEILAISAEKDYKTENNVLILESSSNFKRLALTRKVYHFLFSCQRKSIETKMKQYDWKSIYSDSFSLRICRANKTVEVFDKTEKELAVHVWNAVDNPKVDLEYPRTKIEMVLTDKNAYFGLLVYQVNESFANRRSHLRPHNQPTSLDPKLARACVNLSGVRVGETVVDPFCGAGGILLEAGLMRFTTRGYDIDENILKKCESNLDYYKVKRFHLEHLDALNISETADYVVTDLPYGQSSTLTGNPEELYLKFLKNLESILKYKAVVIFPNSVDHKKIISKTKFKIEKEFSVYIHKSLTRNIVVLGK